MNELFKGEDLIFECKSCPDNVTLLNAMNLIGKPFHTGKNSSDCRMYI